MDITAPDAKPYPGWPRTIDQLDNYARQPVGFLPTLTISGMVNPVVQVIDEETGEIVYTLRINGAEFRPKVFKRATYTLKVGEPGTNRVRILTNVETLDPDESETIEVSL